MRLLHAAQRHGSGRSRPLHQRCTCCTPGLAPSLLHTSSSPFHALEPPSLPPALAAAAAPSPSTGPMPTNPDLARLRTALPNARDLAEAYPAIPPGRIIRCANPSSTSSQDAEFLLGHMGVRDLIDLRAAEEILEDDPGSALMARTTMKSYRRGWLWSGQLYPAPPDVPNVAAPVTTAPTSLHSTVTDSTPKSPSTSTSSSGPPSSTNPSTNPTCSTTATNTAIRHHLSLLDRRRYYLALASRLPPATVAAALATNLVSKPAARKMLLPYVNGGGLPMLYEMLLESSRPEIRQVMEVVLAAAECCHAVMFFCRAGKDRTGLVAALVLAVAGATEEQIVEDYARSDAYHRVALAGLESREELAGLDRAQFERAPPEVMRATLEHVRSRYGSLTDYLTLIGFSPQHQQRLRELLTTP